MARIAFFSLVLLHAGAVRSYALDDDLPPPAGGETVPAMPEKPELKEDESIPAPSVGDESLPEPSVDRAQDKASNQVNKAPSDDEIFLPTPNTGDSLNYAPVGAPAPRVTQDDLDWRYNNTNRPAFSLYAGTGIKSYVNPNTISYNLGYMAGVSVRAISLGQTIFLHALLRYSSYGLGNVGSVPGVQDQMLEYGGLGELALSRRFSVFGTMIARQSVVSAQPPTGAENLSDINGIGSPRTIYLGIGAQWDFYVIPHGSIGLHGELSQGLYVLTLAFAMEPMPREKLTLSYDSLGSE